MRLARERMRKVARALAKHNVSARAQREIADGALEARPPPCVHHETLINNNIESVNVCRDAGMVRSGTSFIVEPAGATRRVTHEPELRDCRVRDEDELVCLRDRTVVTINVTALPGTTIPLR